MGWTRYVSAAVVLLVPASALAQPSEAAPPPVDPSAPAPEPSAWTPGAPYPLALAQRPLILPAGGLEATVPLTWTRSEDFAGNNEAFNVYYARPRVRYAITNVEVEGGADIFIAQTDLDLGGVQYPEPDRLTALYLAGRFGLTPDQFVGAEITANGISSDTSTRYVPAVLLGHKLHLSPRAALELALGAGYDTTRYDLGMGMTESASYLFALGQLRAQAQLAPEVAVEARSTLRAFKDVSDNAMSMFPLPTESGFAQEYGLRVVAAVAPMVDAIAGVDLLQSGQANIKQFTFGVAVRSVP